MEADVGSPARLIDMSGAVDRGADTLNARLSVLLAAFVSPVAPVLPLTVTLPDVVGAPATLQVTTAPTGTALPATHAAELGVMVQPVTLTPAGRPVTAQVVPAEAEAVPTFVQVKVPV